MPEEREPAASAAPTPAPGEATSERVHSIFSGIADQYDLFNALSSFGIDRHWRSEAVKAAHLTPDSRVLDLCAGTCDLALALARKGRPAEVVASDFVAEMLAVGERKAAEAADSYAPTTMSFTLADAQDLPFPDEFFDVATVAFGVRNLPDRSANFREVLRQEAIDAAATAQVQNGLAFTKLQHRERITATETEVRTLGNRRNVIGCITERLSLVSGLPAAARRRLR